MIISYTHPYELTQTPMFADTEKDFEKIPVKSSGYIESNKFLVFQGSTLGKKLRSQFWGFVRRA